MIPYNILEMRIYNNRIHNFSHFSLDKYEMQILALNLKYIPTPSIPLNSKEILKDCIDNFSRNNLLAEQFNDEYNENDPNNIFIPFRKYKLKNPNYKPKQDMNIMIINNIVRLKLNTEHDNILPHTQIKNNLTYKQRQALYRLRKNKDIIIKPADKNLGIAIIDKLDYIKVGKEFTSNPTNFISATMEEYNNNNSKFIELINNNIIIKELNKDSTYKDKQLNFHLNNFKNYILSSTINPKIPSIYFLPKVHKPKLGWRPIVGACNTTFTNFSIYLANLLLPYTQKVSSYIKNSIEFKDIIDEYNNNNIINKKEYLVAADVESLYPSINIFHLLTILQKEITNIININNNKTPIVFSNNTLLMLIDFMLKNNIIEFNNEFFKQLFGIIMGNNASVQLANIYMAYIEKEIIDKYFLLACLAIYKRYIDDIFILWKGSYEQLLNFQKEYNNIHPNINLTFEQSKISITFLDLVIYKNINNINIKLYTRTHQKALNKYLYIPYKSYHSKAMHKGWITSELKRYQYQCNDPIEFSKIKKLFHERLRARGFPNSFLKDIFINFDINFNNKPIIHNELTDISRKRKVTLILPYKPSFSNLNPRKLIHNELYNRKLIIAWKKGRSLKDLLCRSKL